MSAVLLAVSNVPPTPAWSPTVAIVMLVCNVIAFALFALTANQRPAPAAGSPSLPGPLASLGLPALLAVTSFGHLLGAGAILGLTNLGVI
ncbi:photosystem I reaction center subunit PsaK [Leptolyngbya sp. FACHB-261]|uniref:photosystem I reaction center subunit PsaK n=1 Tax=Leptolyngbya sp. FACHB-261 TaxID=2692806 RepID=UPI001687EF3A|nr:photosystem I reaction center subunit PsaK [Leptolyngbya sp. FACHB-261]MBD2102954.1 photosystem I reaction center subunit PsaK [Leptolyngbya sp. FACHB-261]